MEDGGEMSLWKVLVGRWGSGAGEVDDVRIDAATNSLQTIDYAHHEVHGGSHFTYSEIDSLGDGGELEILITTPAGTKWGHLTFQVIGALHTTVEFFEDCTHVAGAAKTSYDNNRNTQNTASITLAANGGTGADGVKIFETQFGLDAGGGANRVTSGGEGRSEAEWILEANNKYLLTVTSLTDANEVAVILSWYEHTDKH